MKRRGWRWLWHVLRMSALNAASGTDFTGERQERLTQRDWMMIPRGENEKVWPLTEDFRMWQCRLVVVQILCGSLVYPYDSWPDERSNGVHLFSIIIVVCWFVNVLTVFLCVSSLKKKKIFVFRWHWVIGWSVLAEVWTALRPPVYVSFQTGTVTKDSKCGKTKECFVNVFTVFLCVFYIFSLGRIE